MPETVFHPSADEDIDAEPNRGGIAGTSRWQKLVGVLGLVVVLWVGSEMYDVVFFDGFGPGSGGGAPAVDQAPGQGPVHTGPPAGGH